MTKKEKNQFLKLVRESIKLDKIKLNQSAYTAKEVKEMFRELKMDIEETAAYNVRNL